MVTSRRHVGMLVVAEVDDNSGFLLSGQIPCSAFIVLHSAFEFDWCFGTCAAKFDAHFAEKLQLCPAI